MSTHVVKMVVCDRCSKERAAQVVSESSIGWARLFVQSGHVNKDLCEDCWRAALEPAPAAESPEEKR